MSTMRSQTDTPLQLGPRSQAPTSAAEPLRIVFLGTPEFALPSLRALVSAGHQLVLAVTAPPRRAGRGLHLVHPPVARAAIDLGIDVFQPERIRAEESVARIASSHPTAVVVAAYGQILPASILNLPPLGCVNVHPSLLPLHRGAAPISGAILAGDTTTGVSIMLMDEGMDTGPVLAQRAVPLDDGDDQISLTARLAELGAELLAQTLTAWATGSVAPMAQNPKLATLTRPTRRADGALDWSYPARDVWLRIRAFADWPQGHTLWDGKLLRISSASYDPSGSGEPGLVQSWGSRGRKGGAVAIGTGHGLLIPHTLQLQGSKACSVDAFLRGHPSLVGSRLTSASPPS